jgi:rod shape determining protein RodA
MQIGVPRRMVTQMPWGLVGVALAICLVGLWNLHSAVRPPMPPMWSTQAMYIGVGLAAMFAVCLVDYRLIQRMALPIYLANIVVLLLLPFIGHKAKGAESWLVLGPFRVQPAEFMKIGVILMLAKFFHEDYKPNQEPYGLIRLIRPVIIVMVPFVLVLKQPDLGTALMIFLSSLTVILFARIKRWILVLMAAGFALFSVVIWNDYVREGGEYPKTVVRHHLKRHQSARISGWLDPESDLRGTNYHAAQSRIAVGSGQFWGKGRERITQTMLSFLPEQHTDFIFSVWAEEHGFLGCAFMLLLYGLLLLFALGVAVTSRDLFGAFVAVGVAAMLFWQVFENIGMVSGLLPVTGITLPLLSYGGSSMVSVFVSLGLLVNISVRRHIF